MRGSQSEIFLQLIVAGHCFNQGTWAVVQYAAESNNTTVTVLQLDGLELEPALGTSKMRNHNICDTETTHVHSCCIDGVRRTRYP